MRDISQAEQLVAEARAQESGGASGGAAVPAVPQRLQRQAPLQAVALCRLRMKRPRVQPLNPSEGQKRARSITTAAAPRKSRSGLIIAAIHLVFVSIRRRFTAMQL